MFKAVTRSIGIGVFAAGALLGAAGIASAEGHEVEMDVAVGASPFDRPDSFTYRPPGHTVHPNGIPAPGIPKGRVPAIPAPGGGIEGGPLASAGEWIN